MLDAYLQGGCQGVSIRPVPRADLGEVFAQEPIRDHLGLIFKLGWYRLHDRAEPVSLLAINLAKNFGRVSADQGAIRHDLFSKQQRLGSKRAIGWGYSHLDQRTLFFGALSRWPSWRRERVTRTPPRLFQPARSATSNRTARSWRADCGDLSIFIFPCRSPEASLRPHGP